AEAAECKSFDSDRRAAFGCGNAQLAVKIRLLRDPAQAGSCFDRESNYKRRRSFVSQRIRLPFVVPSTRIWRVGHRWARRKSWNGKSSIRGSGRTPWGLCKGTK